ncbi:copper resistance protein NlpE N-terminal domain-containing protein [Candidatus Gottesmanbacteria bacterium]|nr:copper resistance protein NlpE N-terminal domain-containing protein [Candidatus Gottesmanbacteria bacterium]
MNRRVVFISLLILIFTLGYIYYTKFPNNYFENLVAKPSVVKYSGTLPCADCPGINEVITFVQSQNNPPSGTFTIRDVYQERNDNQPSVTKGTWMQTTGTANDSKAVVYVLTTENIGDSVPQTSYYLKLNENQIVRLDSDKNQIGAPFNMTLTLTK